MTIGLTFQMAVARFVRRHVIAPDPYEVFGDRPVRRRYEHDDMMVCGGKGITTHCRPGFIIWAHNRDEAIEILWFLANHKEYA